jgi:hypothetical protein
MKAFLATLTIAGMLAATPFAWEPQALAAEPSPSPHPKSLPIRGVTVDVQKMDQVPSDSGASHIEAPPLRMFRLNAAPPAPGAANEMAAPAAQDMKAAPAAARAKAAPAVSPSPSPTPRSR